RRGALLGWVDASFRLRDLISGILAGNVNAVGVTLDLDIYDGTTVHPDSRMFDSNEGVDTSAARFQAVRSLTLYGRPWVVLVRSLPAFEAQLNQRAANMIALVGELGSLILAWALWLLLGSRRRVVELAREMTADLRQSEARQARLNRAL
ncbi:hypothetical protein H3H36_26405, partial [Duganella sp. FT3S]|nr:hypothetical protein [Rugamonas fusca]